MRMKKSCDGCKASRNSISAYIDHHVDGVTCDLGYKCVPKYFGFVVVGGVPQEVCPKPVTWKQWDDVMAERHA